MSFGDVRICVLAPLESAASRLDEALALPASLRWVAAADRITQEDHLIVVADWQQGSTAACAAARARTAAPIILLVSDTSSKTTVEGLRAGADVVLPETTDPTELQARTRALLRRQRAAPTVDPFHVLRLSDSTL